jgi:hypothetical protein
MRQPWTITSSGEVVRVEPERSVFTPGAWDDVEAELGVRLPSDYRELIGDGPACIFDGEMAIASPFDPQPGTNLFVTAARCAWALAYLRHRDPGRYDVAIHPEAGGLLGWGDDGGGANYHWDTRDDDPDRWTVAVTGRAVFDPDIQRHPVGLVRYIEALASGEIQAAALGDWPTRGARIERRPI